MLPPRFSSAEEESPDGVKPKAKAKRASKKRKEAEADADHEPIEEDGDDDEEDDSQELAGLNNLLQLDGDGNVKKRPAGKAKGVCKRPAGRQSGGKQKDWLGELVCFRLNPAPFQSIHVSGVLQEPFAFEIEGGGDEEVFLDLPDVPPPGRIA